MAGIILLTYYQTINNDSNGDDILVTINKLAINIFN